MSEVHITKTEVIKTKHPLTDEEKRIIQTMVIVGSTKKEIEKHLLRINQLLVKSHDVVRVHFVDSGDLTESHNLVRDIIDLDNVQVQ